jgi:hypothetical protein
MSFFDDTQAPPAAGSSPPPSGAFFDDTQTPSTEKDPGYLGEAWRGVKHGAAVTIPKSVGEAAQFFGFDKAGQAIVDWAQSNENAGNVESAVGRANPEWYSVRGNVYEAADNAGLSLAPGAAGAAIGATVGSVVPGVGTGLGALVGYGLGSIAALPIFYGSQAQQTYQKVKQAQLDAGATPEAAEAEARKAGHYSGAIEAGGEAATDVIPFAKLAKPFARPVGKVAGNLVKDTFFPGLKQGAKSIAEIEAGEIGTEMAQQAGESAVEGAHGAGPGATWADTASVIMPTALMSLIPGAAGAGAHHLKLRADAQRLGDPATDPETRAKIALGAASAMQATSPETARAFSLYAAKQIQSGAPIDLAGADQLYHDHAAASGPISAEFDPLSKIATATSIDEVIEAAQNAIDYTPPGMAETAALKAENLTSQPGVAAPPIGNEVEFQGADATAPAAAIDKAQDAEAARIAEEAQRVPYEPTPVPGTPLELAPAEQQPAPAAAPGLDIAAFQREQQLARAAPIESASLETAVPPPQQPASGAAPQFQDYTGNKSVPRTFSSPKGAALFIRANKLAGWAPREGPNGWLISRPVTPELALAPREGEVAAAPAPAQNVALEAPLAPEAVAATPAQAAAAATPEHLQVADAIARGEKVPPEILAKYPALAELAKAKEAIAAARTLPAAAARPLGTANAPQGMQVGPVRAAVQHIIRRSKVPVSIVQSVKELPFSAAPDTKGIYDQGHTWLVADNLSSPLDAERILARHEFVHAGYDILYGGNRAARENALRSIHLKNPKLRELASAWRLQYGEHFVTDVTAAHEGMTREAAHHEMVMRSMEEAVAYLSQESEPIRGLRQFVAVIQRGLRAMGFKRMADAFEKMTDAEALSEISRILKATEEPTQAHESGVAQPAFARRLFRGMRRTANDFILPDTPEYEGNRTGDLAVITKEAAASHPRIEPLPIRLAVGTVKGVHQGFGLLHMKAEADADPGPRRSPRKLTADAAENFAREVADIARNGNRLYYDEPRDRVVLQSPAGYGIVLEPRRSREGEGDGTRYYSVLTMFKPKDPRLWGSPVRIGRADLPITEPPQSVAPELSPGQKSAEATPSIAGVQTEHFDFNPEGGEKQEPEKTPPKASQAGFAALVQPPAPPDWVAKQSEAMQESLRKAGAWRPQPGLKQRIASWTENWQAKVRQGMVDQFDPIKSLDYHAYMLARMSKSSAGPLESMLFDGTVYLDKDGAVDVRYEKGGFVGLMQKLLGEHDRFFSWVIANRAERLLAEGKEHNLSAEDIARLKTLSDGTMYDGKSRAAVYMQANADLQRYNKAAVDMAAKAGLIDAESRPLWEKDFYIPFYRLTDDNDVKGPVPKKGLVRQYAFKALKGGAEVLGDPMENILKNWAHLIDASLKNNAARASILAAEKMGVAIEAPEETARQMAKAAGMKDAVVYFTDQGVKRHFVIDDPFVFDAVNSLAFTGFSGTGMKIMGTFKHWLTFGTTISPTFRLRNLIRDSLTMIGTNPAEYNVLTNVLTGWKATEEGSAVYASMIAGGGVIRFGSQQEDGARNVKRLIDAGVDEATILDSPEKLKGMLTSAYDWWQHVGDRSENINRAALYQQLRAQGRSHLEASYAARDTMDFSMQGTWAGIRFLTQTVPFFNARLQGLYKLGRGAAEDPRRFAYVVGATALASVALLLAYKDDDDWKQREDWDRETYWWFKIGNKAFRIPKPFEIGAIGTLAERGVELMATNDLTGKQFAQRMGSVVGQQLSMNPVPQLFMPMIETWANQNTFTNRAIESQGMEKLSPSMRANPDTSAFAQLLGKNNVVSPVQIDHLVSGYFGWLGMHAIATADLALRPAMGMPGKPAPRINEVFVAGDFAKDVPDYQSKYITRLYQQGKEVQEMMADVRQLEKVGALDKALELLHDNPNKAKLVQLYNAAEHELTTINQRIKIVQTRDSDPALKRQQLDALYAMKNRVARLTDERAQLVTQ